VTDDTAPEAPAQASTAAPAEAEPRSEALEAGALEAGALEAGAVQAGTVQAGTGTDAAVEVSGQNVDDAAEIEFIAAERVIFFSDAVVAIAITLLALGLPLPHGSTNSSVLHSMNGDEGAYLAFVIGFAVIGTHWRVHHRMFMYVARLDRRLISVNMVWLFMIVLMPFATRVLSGNGAFGIRFGLYALIQAITALCFLQMMRMLRHHALQRPDAPDTEQGGSVLLITVAAMFLISIPFAFVTQWAYVCWIAIPLVTSAARRLQGGLGTPQASAATAWPLLIRAARRPAPDRARPSARR
jgi:uncharacterized membrane protein